MINRITRQQMLLEIATTVSKRSTCLRLQVGAVVAIEGRVLSMGYNGSPSGLEHCSFEYCKIDSPCKRTIHAEANAIAFAARHGVPIKGSELFVTHSPCLDCAKLIINSGIVKVTYILAYRDPAPLELLSQAGISVLAGLK